MNFKCCSSDTFITQSHFGGHYRKKKFENFYVSGFVETSRRGETHVSPEYNKFLDKAIGAHRSLKSGPEPNMQAVAEKKNLPVFTLHVYKNKYFI